MGLLLCPAAFPARGGGSGGRPSPFPARDTFIALFGQKSKITNAVVFASFGIRAKRASPPYAHMKKPFSRRPARPRVPRRKAAARRFRASLWRSPSGKVGFRASPWRSPSGEVGFHASPWRSPSGKVGFRASLWRSPSGGVGFRALPCEREGRVRFLHIDSRRPPRPLA